MPEKIINLVCEYCGKTFPRRLSEHKRSKRIGRPSYCSMSCAMFVNNKKPGRKYRGGETLRLVNCVDEFSQFRYAMGCVRRRAKLIIRRCKQYDIDVEYLKQIWEEQDGICPLTGWDIELPPTSAGWNGDSHLRRASLDRIDNSLGYMKGNVRFVSIMVNYCRNAFEDKDLIEFCKAVVDNIPKIKQNVINSERR